MVTAREIQVGVVLPGTQPAGEVIAHARLIEASGLDSVWLGDHFYFDHFVTDAHAERQEEQPDPYQLLYAAERDLTLVAYNGRDHFLLHQAWGIWTHRWGVADRHAGILLVPHVRPD